MWEDRVDPAWKEMAFHGAWRMSWSWPEGTRWAASPRVKVLSRGSTQHRAEEIPPHKQRVSRVRRATAVGTGHWEAEAERAGVFRKARQWRTEDS